MILALWCVPTLVVLAQAPVPHNGTAPLDSALEHVRNRIIEKIAAGEVPSIAVVVAREGEVIWEEAFGWADRDGQVEATPNTIYAVGSLSKSITATGVMRLVEQGRVDLDDAAGPILGPGGLHVFTGREGDVTIRRLLHMTAGIPHGWATFPGTTTSTERADYQDRSGIVVFPPGEVYEYSNNSYGVLGRIIEQVSGRNLADYMRDEIFLPLGMVHASVGSSPDFQAQTAVLYEADGSVRAPYTFEPLGGAGYYASARDLIRYGLYHLGETGENSLLRLETLHRMHTDKDVSVPNALMALGWGSGMLDDSTLWLITNGSIGGGNSHLTLVPSKRVAVLCLINRTSESLADQLAIEITDAVIPGFAENVNRAIQEYTTTSNRPYEPDPRLTGRWTGTIQTISLSHSSVPDRSKTSRSTPGNPTPEGSTPDRSSSNPSRPDHSTPDRASPDNSLPDHRIAHFPVTLIFTPEGPASLQFEGEDASPLESISWEANLLRGRFRTTTPILPDIGNGIPENVDFKLWLNGNKLSGYVSLRISDSRATYSLPAFIECTRDSN